VLRSSGTDEDGREDLREVAPFGELLIDCEEDRTLRAVVIGMLRERQRGGWRD
jgi:hypothetical protein